MSFRQRNKYEEQRWLRTHRHQLESAGVPGAILDDGRAWIYVLLHGDDELGSGWDPTWISDEQARTLLSLLREFYVEPVGLDLLDGLERRIAAGNKKPAKKRV